MAEEAPVVPKAGLISPIPEAELREIFSGPALHTNKFYATNLAAGLRIAFMEAMLEPVQPQFRTAVILAYQDAIALRDLLTHQLREIEPQLKQAEAATRAMQPKADG
jgi:hypothetical protein